MHVYFKFVRSHKLYKQYNCYETVKIYFLCVVSLLHVFLFYLKFVTIHILTRVLCCPMYLWAIFLKPINGCYMFLFISCSVYFLRFMFIGTIYICILLVYNNFFKKNQFTIARLLLMVLSMCLAATYCG